MQTKKLLILVVAALAAIGLGIWLASERSSSPQDELAVLYPELKKSLDQVTGIRIFNAGDKQSVEIARKDANWVITERHGFAADDAKVRKLLLSLANAKIEEEKTSNPENY